MLGSHKGWEHLIQISVNVIEPKDEEHGVGSDAGISFHSEDSPLNGGSWTDLAILTVANIGAPLFSLWISSSVTPLPEEERQGLGHLFKEAGQVYVPF